jgi:signal transduction histidine kinase
MMNQTEELKGAPEQNSPHLFQSLVAQVDEGVMVLEASRRVTYANTAAEFLLAHKQDELVGEMFGLPLIASKEPTRINVISADGRMRLVELHIEPFPAEQDGRLLLRLKDITAYHQDLVRAREEVRRRDEFLAMLSHELRNPLAAMSSAAALLTHNHVDPSLRQSAAEIIKRQLRHLTRLLDDLLDITRISRGKLEVRKEHVEIGHIVRDAVEEVMPQITKRGHALSIDVPQEQLWLWGDATRLAQVIVNLLNNAAKFTPPGGHLSLTVRALPTEVEIRVCDDGPGIAEDLMPHIFDPFVQGQQTLDRSDGGLGLGLSLADAIVRLHGGSITAQPNEDCPGVVFTVRLPFTVAGQTAAAAPPEPRPARPLRILLIEDSRDVRCMLKDLLRLDGHEVLEADNGAAGLTALLEQQPDLALVDIGVPGLDGYEIARQARQDARGRKLRLIALTGYGTPQDVNASREAGFDSHLVKPLSQAALDKILRGH